MRSALAQIIAGTFGLVIHFGVIAETAPYLRGTAFGEKMECRNAPNKDAVRVVAFLSRSLRFLDAIRSGKLSWERPLLRILSGRR